MIEVNMGFRIKHILIRELFEVYKLVGGRIQFELVQKFTLKEILKIQFFFYNEILKINEEKKLNFGAHETFSMSQLILVSY
jgi:hypothetical protein